MSHMASWYAPRDLRLRATVLLAALFVAQTARAANPEQPERAPKPEDQIQFVDHSGPGPLYFGAEANNILQIKPEFRAKYSGTNSLQPNTEAALSGLLTAFFAY